MSEATPAVYRATTGAPMAHEEFPSLRMPEKQILCAGLKLRISMLGGIRPFVAAIIRQAAKQAQEARSPGYTGDLVSVQDLLSFADNIHSLPPSPTFPTREEMEAALQQLLPHLGYYLKSGSRINCWVETLQRGIAHHCNVQP
jgi:hypothetical protein